MTLNRIAFAAWILWVAVAGFYFGTLIARGSELETVHASISPLPFSNSQDVAAIDPAITLPIMERTRKALADLGYPVKPQTYPAYLTRLNGLDGMSVSASIVVNSESLPGCFEIIVGHEFAHLALAHDYGMTPRQSERFAKKVERSFDFKPNCESE